MKVTYNGPQSGGTKMMRSWDAIARAMSRDLNLTLGESVDAVEVDTKTGAVYFTIKKVNFEDERP